ncbi:capsular biosynthesis protein [Paraburkholderia sp. RCC_158]|uniref:capsular polysaccharide export protein, LipB/KpsS family n=1 Tax=Paraburkholderia sp. RCC_158 TaxID=3239220 RepID=UPI003524F2DE
MKLRAAPQLPAAISRPRLARCDDALDVRLDSRIGRIVWRLVRPMQMQMHITWPGVIMPRADIRAPALSWFTLRGAQNAPWQLYAAIDDILTKDASAGFSADVAKLMHRVRALYALDSELVLPICDPAILAHPASSHVVLIDERESAIDTDWTSRQRRAAFGRMVEAAQAAHPGATFWLGRSASCGNGAWLSSARSLPPGTRRLSPRHSLCAALEKADHVYTVSAHEAAHSVLGGQTVHVFGAPYFAGWGLTDDHHPVPTRRSRPRASALFDAVFLRLSQYVDPSTHESGTLTSLLDSVELQRNTSLRFEALGNVAGMRFRWWKRPFATPFLRAGAGRLRWVDSAEELSDDECVAVWGARPASDIGPATRIVRMEDGFIHSTGLGSDMVAPCSQVIDTQHLYFDATGLSDLTVLLNEADFDDEELMRASKLRQMICTAGLTKYNLGRKKPTWRAQQGKTVILVPGQVADDASIRLGTGAISTSTALLREVRARRPDAFIVYKPHPDVLSGNRRGLIDANRLADVVDTEADLISLIDVSDEVHTLSSLSGFDALLRGKIVHAYGIPFYAGWGLTHDVPGPVPHRQRRLSLDTLVSAALIRYPVYFDWTLKMFTTPEAVVRQLTPPSRRPLAPVRSRSRPAIKIVRWIRNALHHLHWRIGQKNKRTETATLRANGKHPTNKIFKR